jgi:hypothetical protein
VSNPRYQVKVCLEMVYKEMLIVTKRHGFSPVPLKDALHSKLEIRRKNFVSFPGES